MLAAGFHGDDAVAQLKQRLDVGQRGEARAGFHGGDAVAQLKHGRNRQIGAGFRGFPRRRRRGSIEARTTGG